jgi:hypothetical protein
MLGKNIAKANALRCVEDATMPESVKLKPMELTPKTFIAKHIIYF